MTGLARWSLGIGFGLLVVAVLFRALNVIPVTVIVGILGLLAVGMAGYDVLFEWQKSAQLRRKERVRLRQERDARGGR